MQSVTIYTKPNCVQCDMTKKWFNKNGVDYETEDIYEEKNLAAVQELGFAAAPVIIVSQGQPKDEVYWAGFQPAKLEEHIKVGS